MDQTLLNVLLTANNYSGLDDNNLRAIYAIENGSLIFSV